MTEQIKIDGMGCAHCITAVRLALEGLNGVKVEDVSIGTARVQLNDGATAEQVDAAIREAGYEPVSHERQ